MAPTQRTSKNTTTDNMSVARRQTLEWDDATPSPATIKKTAKKPATKIANQLPKPTVDVKGFCEQLEASIAKTFPMAMQYFDSKIEAKFFEVYERTKNKKLSDLGEDLDEYLERVQLGLKLFLKAFPEDTKTIPEHSKTIPEHTKTIPECEPVAKQTCTQASNHLAKYKKFAVKRGGKEPACKWSDPANYTKAPFDPKHRNTGIPTGPTNNLLIVDLDVKDDGVEEFKKYIAQHGNPQTFTVRTPSGGYHYYFNYSSANKDDELIIKSCLKNASKYRGKGIDIRSAGGYIVAPPSRRDGKPYSILRDVAPIDIPASLISWLIVGHPPVVKVKVEGECCVKEWTPKNYEYELSEEQLKSILEKLPDKYLHNYSDWLMVTTVMKFHNQREIWDKWCRQSPNYNRSKNETQWNYNKGFIDINYLVWVLRKLGHDVEYVTRFKPYHPITRDISNIKQIHFDKKFVSEGLSYKDFAENETIIIKSCTGTGKTTAVAQHAQRYMNDQTKFLSITTRTSLSDQHAVSFKDLGMKNYQDVRANLQDIDSLTLCLNSLGKLGELDDDELANYVVYIDEVSSFLELTHNDTLDSILKTVFALLSRLVKFAGKVVVSDALITDNVFEFLKHRSVEKTVMLTNAFQKFKDVPAVRLRSEPAFLEKLVEHCNSNQPFLFGSDSCEVVTKFFHRCVDRLTDKTLKDKFLLVTAETATRIKNASEEFKDKFVFFSPKITFGVDFSIDAPQDMFIYIKGDSITPAGSFQQATRTRNIKSLYFHSECAAGESHFDTLDSVHQNVEACLLTSKSLATTCTYVDECDEVKFVRNSFFNLFCYNEFAKDIFASNKVKHFELFLLQNGFDVRVEGQPRKLCKEEKATQKSIVDEITEEHFQEFLTTADVNQPKFESIMKNVAYLNLNPSDRKTVEEFRDTVCNKYRVQEHDSILRLLKSTEYIDEHLAELQAKSIDAKLLSNSYTKAKLIKEFGVRYGLTLFNVADRVGQENVSIDDGFWQLVKQTFRINRKKPETKLDLKHLFVSVVRAMTCKNIIMSKQLKTKKDRDTTAYILHTGLLKYHLALNQFKNKGCKHFAPEVVQEFGLQVAADDFLDDIANDLDV